MRKVSTNDVGFAELMVDIERADLNLIHSAIQGEFDDGTNLHLEMDLSNGGIIYFEIDRNYTHYQRTYFKITTYKHGMLGRGELTYQNIKQVDLNMSLVQTREVVKELIDDSMGELIDFMRKESETEYSIMIAGIDDIDDSRKGYMPDTNDSDEIPF